MVLGGGLAGVACAGFLAMLDQVWRADDSHVCLRCIALCRLYVASRIIAYNFESYMLDRERCLSDTAKPGYVRAMTPYELRFS